jgi:hypothetical protein
MSATDQELELLTAEAVAGNTKLGSPKLRSFRSIRWGIRGSGLQILEHLPILPVRRRSFFRGRSFPGRRPGQVKKLIDAVITGNKILGVVAAQLGHGRSGAWMTCTESERSSAFSSCSTAEGQQSIIVHGLLRFGIEHHGPNRSVSRREGIPERHLQ